MAKKGPYSKRDLHFLQRIYKMAGIFAMVPSYDFENFTLKKVLFRKIQGGLLLAVLLLGTVYSLSQRLYKFQNIYRNSHLIIDFVNEVFHVSTSASVILSACFLHRDQFLKLNNSFQYVDKMLGNNGKRLKYWYSSADFHLFLYFVCYCALTIFTSYTWMNVLNMTVWQTYSIHQFCYLINLILYYMVFCMALAFYVRYKDINALLDVNQMKGYNKCRWQSQPVVFLREVGSLTRIMSEMVDWFNGYFGWTMVFMCAKAVMELLLCVNFVISKPRIPDAYFERSLFVSSCLLAFLQVLSSFCITVSCDFARSECGRTSFLCFKLQEQFPENSDERRELLSLAAQVKCNANGISAAGFFDMNRATFFGILATTTTYVIVIIQYSGVKL